MKLYEFDNAILNCIDQETGEIVDTSLFEQLNLEKETKLKNICWLVNESRAEQKAHKEIEEAHKRKRQVAERNEERLLDYLSMCLAGEEFKPADRSCSITYRKSEKVEVEDVRALPEEFIKFSYAADKAAIKTAIKNGQTVEGAKIVEERNIQVK